MVMRGLELIPASIGWEPGYTLHSLLQEQHRDKQPYSLSVSTESQIKLACMFFDCGRKPELLERTCKLHTERPKLRFELLWVSQTFKPRGLAYYPLQPSFCTTRGPPTPSQILLGSTKDRRLCVYVCVFTLVSVSMHAWAILSGGDCGRQGSHSKGPGFPS